MPPAHLFLSATLLMSVLGCQSVISEPPSSEAAQARQDLQTSFSTLWPSPGLSVRTTRADIHIRNLNASIQALESLRLKDLHSPRLATLAELRYQRFRITGSLDDLYAALEDSRSQVNRTDATASDWLTRARLLSGIHRFKQAAIALKNAEREGASAESITLLSEDINRSIGRAEASPDDDLLVQSRAALQQGHATLAISLIQQHERQHLSSDPFVLSWSLLQQGVILLEHDLINEANQVFAAAHQRLPDFYLATEHLAETEWLLGHHERAAVLYQQVIEQNDLPLFHWQLARVFEILGQVDLSQYHLDRAISGYHRLLETWPDTFNDHAIDFYLQQGDPDEALRLARRLVENQPTVANRVVLAETALSNKTLPEACDQWSLIQATGNRSISVLKLAETLSQSCTRLTRSK